MEKNLYFTAGALTKSATNCKRKKLHFIVNYQSNKVMSLSACYYDDETLTKVIFDEIQRVTGVPVNQQILGAGGRCLRPDVKLKEYNLQNGCTVNLSVTGLGGGGDSSDSGNLL